MSASFPSLRGGAIQRGAEALGQFASVLGSLEDPAPTDLAQVGEVIRQDEPAAELLVGGRRTDR